MGSSLLNTIYQNRSTLLEEVEQHIAQGADLNHITEYGESVLRVASNNGRFDVIKLLIDHGADQSQLGWTDIFHVIAYGSKENLMEGVTGGCDLEARDYWSRTPLLFSILVGDTGKTDILLNAGADRDAVGRCWKVPLAYATQKDDADMLVWLIEQGFDIEQRDEFQYTPLITASEAGAIKCVRALLEKGADLYAENHIPDQAIGVASNIEVVMTLVEAGADLNDMDREARSEMLGYRYNEEPDTSKEEYTKGHRRTFGRKNPERSVNPFWYAMVKCGGSGYHASSKFEKNRDIYKGEPVWSYDRFGKSINLLPDGRFIEIAGEHEDHYDPDFCIYNDVFVHDGKGSCDIYCYPRETFPPTDFHTATLIENQIYIIGNLGYGEDRKAGFTPVYRLNIETFAIEEVKTTGDMPGWISDHKAVYDGQSMITISGGKLIINKKGEEDYVDNHETFCLCLKSMEWSKN